MNIYDTWKPRTYYILENKTSGKKYIGQTTQDINKYLGSGRYWKNHCKKHGGYNRKNISIVYSEMYETKKSAQQYLDNFKIMNGNYWESHNNLWANLCEENTADCTLTGGEITQKRLDAGTHNFLDGNFQKAVNQKRLDAGTHNFLGAENNQKNNKKRLDAGTHNCLITHTCPHCNKVGDSPVMYRWHFDNCKFK
tara:strand:- start:41 stop:625 length:585 start_codon:yes stop_codon:yes gene_type:complete